MQEKDEVPVELTLSDFQTNCVQYLRQMTEDLVITDRGRPLAHIAPADTDVVIRAKKLRQNLYLHPDSIKSLKEEGRK